MKKSFSINESELILNPDGSIYHLSLHAEDLADTIILVGDPARVATISSYFDRVEVKKQNREITTHTGELGGKRLSVLSTGMGAGNMDIVMNELGILASINLGDRTRLEIPRALRLIRLGTSGAIKAAIPVDSYVASHYAIGLDGILQFYQQSGGRFRQEMASEFARQVDWPAALALPYAVEGSEKLMDLLAYDMLQGITLTASGFYAPQGRVINAELAFPELHHTFGTFSYNESAATNLEMETSSLYGFSSIFGFEAITICAILANRVDQTFSHQPKQTIKKLIEITLDRLN